MHETGIRILIRKVQLIGAQYDKALSPLFSYFKNHYYRIFFKCEKGKKKVDDLLVQHKYLLYNFQNVIRLVSESNHNKRYEYAGPLWTGKLWDQKLVEKMLLNCDTNNKKMYDLLSVIKEECQIDAVGFYDLHKIAKIKKKPVQKIEDVLNKGISRTHFIGWGVRSNNFPL
jgi:tRNA (guanine26-N2/guanine27-N2)-dimethyltransferase